MTLRTVLAAPDKFRGSLTAPEACEAIARGAARAGWSCLRRPLADGGEGTLDAFGGGNRSTVVTGPAGTPVRAVWRLDDDRVAVIESAAASGLDLAGGPEGNDPMAATSAGTGELLAAAVRAGARRIIVGLGGSATSDGGSGAMAALSSLSPATRRPPTFPELGIEVLVASDVETEFTDAARVFGPQKGADDRQVADLTRRLQRLQAGYRERYGVALAGVRGGGAAGGLGGALAVLGGRIVPGAELVAEQVGLDESLSALGPRDLVVTGEGLLDAQSFRGKTVGAVHQRSRRRGIPLLVVAGGISTELPDGVTGIGLLQRFGEEAAWERTAECVATAVAEHCATLA